MNTNEDRSSSAEQGRILAGGRKKGLIFLEGAQFAACLFSSLSKKRPPIHSYRKSEQHTDR